MRRLRLRNCQSMEQEWRPMQPASTRRKDRRSKMFRWNCRRLSTSAHGPIGCRDSFPWPTKATICLFTTRKVGPDLLKIERCLLRTVQDSTRRLRKWKPWLLWLPCVCWLALLWSWFSCRGRWCGWLRVGICCQWELGVMSDGRMIQACIDVCFSHLKKLWMAVNIWMTCQIENRVPQPQVLIWMTESPLTHRSPNLQICIKLILC